MTIHSAAAEGFSHNADDYERARPSYPPEAVDHLVSALGLGPGRTVVDVAAGTGKLTRLLTGSGARLIAVEPVAEMRAQLEEAVPGARAVEGTAEHLPLAGGTADAITVAQAFHWFDAPAALAEFHRVLVPGGGLGVVFNRRSDGPGWLAEVNDLINARRSDDLPHHASGRWREAFASGELFTPLEEAEFDNPQVLDPEGVVARFRSLSWVGALPAREQGALLAEIAHVLATHSDSAGRTELVIPQRTIVSTCSAL